MKRLLLLVAVFTLAAPAFAQQGSPSISRAREYDLRVAMNAVRQAADFKPPDAELEIYRTLRAAGVSLSSAEVFSMGEAARMRALFAEADEAYGLLKPSDLEYRQHIHLITSIQEQASRERNGEVEKSVAAAKKRVNGLALVSVAQAFAGLGDHERAVELYEFVISRRQPLDNRMPTKAERAAWVAAQAKAHGRSVAFYEVAVKRDPSVVFASVPYQLSTVELAMAQLNYGISLFKLNRVTEARATWKAVTGSQTAERLAKVWIDLASAPRN